LSNQYSIVCLFFFIVPTLPLKMTMLQIISIFHASMHILFLAIMLCSDINKYCYFFKLHPFLSDLSNIYAFTNYLFSIYMCQALNFAPISIFNAHINMSAVTFAVASIVVNILSFEWILPGGKNRKCVGQFSLRQK